MLIDPGGGRLYGTSTYDGISATRGNISASGGGGSQNQQMSRSGHFARSALTKIKLLQGAFYVNEAGGSWQETGTGDITYTASVEYPAGTFTQLKSGGSTSWVVPSGTTAVTDYVNVSIPSGAKFWIRQFMTCATATLPYYFGKNNSSMGDAMNYANSGLSDQTMSGTVLNGPSGGGTPLGINFPQGIISPISIGSVWFPGDSIDDGQGDTFDAGGDTGFIARSVGPSFGYASNCTSGDMAHFFKTSNALRKASLPYCTTAIFGYGRNDFASNGSTLGDFESDLTTCYAGIPANVRKVYQCTVLPGATSTDNFATLGNQNKPGWDAARVSFNDAVRAGSFGPGGFIDACAALESSLDSGKWIVTPSPPYPDSGGIHPLPAGIALAVAFPVLPTSLIL